MTGARTSTVIGVALAATLVLAGCGEGDGPPAGTTTDADATDDDRLAALEAELAEMRGEGGDDADDADDDGTDRAPGDDAPRVIELDETRQLDGDDLELTVDRALVHEHWIEIELSVTNLHTESRKSLWGSGGSRPRLFDEQDRRFEYQHPAGTSNIIRLDAGQTAEAVLVFGGRLHPNAETVTLRFGGQDIGSPEFTFPISQASS